MRWQMGRRSSNVEDMRGSRFGGNFVNTLAAMARETQACKK